MPAHDLAHRRIAFDAAQEVVFLGRHVLRPRARAGLSNCLATRIILDI
jgi:hypothetical protein